MLQHISKSAAAKKLSQRFCLVKTAKLFALKYTFQAARRKPQINCEERDMGMKKGEAQSKKASVERQIDHDAIAQKNEEAKERQRQYNRDYYLKNREKLRLQKREYYANCDKVAYAARGRKYYADNREKMAANAREYRQRNLEKCNEWAKKSRQKNKEKIAAYREVNKERLLAARREYRAKNRERILAYQRDYYLKTREKHAAYREANRERLRAYRRDYYAKNREKQKAYIEKNKYRIYNYSLNCYTIKAIEQIRNLHADRVLDYMNRYPFEDYAEQYIKIKLRQQRVYPSQGRYDDCFDAGMLAYLYSIHRCAAMQYAHTEAYIKKLVGIYIIQALVVYDESKYLCKTNGFREIHLDADYSANRF